MQQTESYKYEVLLKYDYLQRVVRDPRYIRLCEEIKFDDTGFACPPVFDDVEAYEKIKNEFGLLTVVDPSVVIEERYDPEDFSQLPIFNDAPFACCLLFDTTKGDEKDISNPIHDGHYLILSVDRLATIRIIRQSVKEYMKEYRTYMPGDLAGLKVKPKEASLEKQAGPHACGFVKTTEEGRVTIKINLLASEKDIFDELKKYIPRTTGRIHLEKRNIYYKIWDRRKEWESFSNIALRFSLKEDQARKSFRRAFTLIRREKYEDVIWQVVVWKHFEKMIEVTSGKAQEEYRKKFAKLKQVSQRKRLIKTTHVKRTSGDWVEGNVQTESWENDPTALINLQDMIRFCENEKECNDKDCKNQLRMAVKKMDFSDFVGCPDYYKFIEIS